MRRATPLIAGIGCRKGTSAGAIIAALNAALANAGHGRDGIRFLATGALKAGEAGLVTAAGQLGLALRIADAEALASVEPRLATHSPASAATTGSGSLCEAAALALAGPDGHLLAPRFIHEGVTIAFATTTGDIA